MDAKPTFSDKKTNGIFSKIFLILVILGVVIYGSLIILKIGPFDPENGNDNSTITTTTSEGAILANISLIVDFGNGTIETRYNITLDKDHSSVYDLMLDHYIISFDSYSNGKLITGINSINANSQSGEYWQYWVNNEYVLVSVDQKLLNSNDVVKWVYGNSNF